MGTGATLIRLIDVVFILLFGFISISEINEKSRIELPKSAETPPSNPDRERVMFVGITTDGHYLVENESKVVGDAETLYRYIAGKAREAEAEGQALRVRVRSNWDTPIKYTLAVTRICDELNLAKGVDVARLGGLPR